MKTFLIDGNNLIGKITRLRRALQQKDKQASREQLVFLLDKYFKAQKNKGVVYFDGFQSTAIASDFLKIKYSQKQTADDLIRADISNAANRKNLTVITSDLALAGFAKACSTEVMKSEVFAKQALQSKSGEDETGIIDKLANQTAEFKKLFGV
ncbi:MAG: NYN domain-containing protein [Ignavibacteriaceae bacterium]|nr:NYN domain-containing protein [Ignavibacteriaceae bacterium]